MEPSSLRVHWVKRSLSVFPDTRLFAQLLYFLVLFSLRHFLPDTRTLVSGSMMMAFSFSSDTSTQEVKDDLSMLITRSLDRMSSFFTWSPVTLVLPAMP